MIPDKINISEIFYAHFRTLRRAKDNKVSKYEVGLFYVLPFALALPFVILFKVNAEGYLNTIISVYTIFSALLINAQVAMYTIFRSWPSQPQSDPVKRVTKNQVLREISSNNSRDLIREVNANLSYLIVISAIALVISLLFQMVSIKPKIEILTSLYVFIHFVLTLLMSIKRIYRLFDVEFQN